jgi:hypothetical protein
MLKRERVQEAEEVKAAKAAKEKEKKAREAAEKAAAEAAEGVLELEAAKKAAKEAAKENPASGVIARLAGKKIPKKTELQSASDEKKESQSATEEALKTSAEELKAKEALKKTEAKGALKKTEAEEALKKEKAALKGVTTADAAMKSTSERVKELQLELDLRLQVHKIDAELKKAKKGEIDTLGEEQKNAEDEDEEEKEKEEKDEDGTNTAKGLQAKQPEKYGRENEDGRKEKAEKTDAEVKRATIEAIRFKFLMMSTTKLELYLRSSSFDKGIRGERSWRVSKNTSFAMMKALKKALERGKELALRLEHTITKKAKASELSKLVDKVVKELSMNPIYKEPEKLKKMKKKWASELAAAAVEVERWDELVAKLRVARTLAPQKFDDDKAFWLEVTKYKGKENDLVAKLTTEYKMSEQESKKAEDRTVEEVELKRHNLKVEDIRAKLKKAKEEVAEEGVQSTAKVSKQAEGPNTTNLENELHEIQVKIVGITAADPELAYGPKGKPKETQAKKEKQELEKQELEIYFQREKKFSEERSKAFKEKRDLKTAIAKSKSAGSEGVEELELNLKRASERADQLTAVSGINNLMKENQTIEKLLEKVEGLLSTVLDQDDKNLIKKLVSLGREHTTLASEDVAIEVRWSICAFIVSGFVTFGVLLVLHLLSGRPAAPFIKQAYSFYFDSPTFRFPFWNLDAEAAIKAIERAVTFFDLEFDLEQWTELTESLQLSNVLVGLVRIGVSFVAVILHYFGGQMQQPVSVDVASRRNVLTARALKWSEHVDKPIDKAQAALVKIEEKVDKVENLLVRGEAAEKATSAAAKEAEAITMLSKTSKKPELQSAPDEKKKEAAAAQKAKQDAKNPSQQSPHRLDQLESSLQGLVESQTALQQLVRSQQNQLELKHAAEITKEQAAKESELELKHAAAKDAAKEQLAEMKRQLVAKDAELAAMDAKKEQQLAAKDAELAAMDAEKEQELVAKDAEKKRELKLKQDALDELVVARSKLQKLNDEAAIREEEQEEGGWATEGEVEQQLKAEVLEARRELESLTARVCELNENLELAPDVPFWDRQHTPRKTTPQKTTPQRHPFWDRQHTPQKTTPQKTTPQKTTPQRYQQPQPQRALSPPPLRPHNLSKALEGYPQLPSRVGLVSPGRPLLEVDVHFIDT